MTPSPTPVLALQEISYALDVPLDFVDLRKDLLDNGASSVTLVRLHYALKALGINLSLETMVSGLSVEDLIHKCIQIDSQGIYASPWKRERKSIATFERPSKRIACTEYVNTIPATLKHTYRYPMTEMQLTLLQSSLSSPGSNIISYHETHLPRDVPALKTAWAKVLRSEPLLSSSYVLDGSKAYVVELDDGSMDWKEVFVTDMESYDREIYKKGSEALAYGNCFRIITLRPLSGNAGRSRVIWRVHHALIDGYSHMLLLSRLEKALNGARLRPTTPFSQFATKLRNLQEALATSAMDYWARKHIEQEKSLSRLLLPTPTRGRALQGRCDTFTRSLDQTLLTSCCNEVGITVPTLYHAAWAVTMARYTDSSNVQFGTVFNGRSLPIAGSHSVIGPAINTLPFHVKVDSNLTVAQYLRDIFGNILALSSLQWTTPEHGFRRDFHTALNIQNDSKLMRKYLVPIEPPFSTVHSDIPLQVEVIPGKVDSIRFHFQLEHFSRSQVETMSEVFITAMTMVQKPKTRMEAYLRSIVDRTHCDDLSSWGNWSGLNTQTASTKDDLVTLFQGIACKYPSAIALQRGSSTMTYAELDTRSSYVARAISHSVAAGDVVCVHADRSFNWIVAIYAVLKAGAIYCPLAEELPAGVRNSNFVASGASLFVIGTHLDEHQKPESCSKTMVVEDILLTERLGEGCGRLSSSGPNPGTGAYLCFTSGSTGNPKGVLCHHRGLVAFQKDYDVRLHAKPGWKIAQVMSPAFDGSIHEIFSTFSYGATLLLRASQGFSHLGEADAAILTPSFARALDVQSFPNLKTVYFVGEAVTQDLNDTWASVKTVFNMYGPTEATCGVTIKRLQPSCPVSLGRPNSSSRVYILDKEQRLAPLGVVGEIYIAGVQVALGYIGNSKISESRFMSDCIIPNLEEQMYKTGDNAYWNEDGELVLVGRSDRQVKLRGFRIDLDGLEAQILRTGRKQAGVTQVAVTVNNGDLIAFVQPKSLDVDRLRQLLRTRLPHYAMPRRIVASQAFPMTPAGKRDYKRLEVFAQCFQNVANDTKPASMITPMERTIIATLREILALHETAFIDPTSNFVDLGATSVSLLFLSHRLTTTLSQKVALQSVIKHQTPRELAQALSTAEIVTASAEGDDEGAVLGERNASPIEADWWYKYQLHHGTSAFNVTFACRLSLKVDLKRLKSAWDSVLLRHRILSCNYRREGDGIVRTYFNKPPRTQFKEDLDVETESHVPFDLERQSLIRVTCTPNTMLVVASHIICDLTTLNSLLAEVADIYTCRKRTSVYVEYSQTRWAKGISCAQQTFWTRNLKGVHSLLPTQVPKRTTWNGNSRLIHIPKAIFQGMKRYITIQKATMHQLALAAVSLALQPDQMDLDIIIGAPHLGRNPETEMGTIGLFLQPLPVRIQYSHRSSSSADFDSYFRAVQRASREALSYALPFDQILSLLDIRPTEPGHQLFDYMVTFHEKADMPKLKIPGVEPIHTWTKGAKFKLMAEFAAATDESLELRLEYSTECFTEVEVQAIGDRIIRSIEDLVTFCVL